MLQTENFHLYGSIDLNSFWNVCHNVCLVNNELPRTNAKRIFQEFMKITVLSLENLDFILCDDTIFHNL